MGEKNKLKGNGKKYDGFAITSFVLSLIGILMGLIIWPINVIVPYVLIIISIILGFVSLSRIKKNKKLYGRIFAYCGIIISILWFLLLNYIIYLNVKGLDI